MSSKAPEPLLVKVEEAARLLSVSRFTVYRMINDKKLPLIKVAGCSRISMDDVKRLAAPATQETAA